MHENVGLGEQKFTRRLEISAVLVENSARRVQNRGKPFGIFTLCRAAVEFGKTNF